MSKQHFWSTDRGLAALLGSLVVIIFVMPVLRASPVVAVVIVQVLFGTVVFSGLTTVTASRVARIACGAGFLAAIALHWVDQFHPGFGLAVWGALGRLFSVCLLTLLVSRQVFAAGRVTVQRIAGAVAVYLLLGLAWAGVYELIAGVFPDAFHLPETPRNRAELATMLAYYSFVTLTTVGYGDLIPVHPVARSAAILEALAGQLFPAILLARLVAMELAARDR
jgi:hypothetical protein